MTGVGRCATSQVAVLVQRFRQDSRSGDHTTTRLLDMSGATLWERVDPGFHLGDVDPTGDIVALPTDTGLVLLGRDGRTVERIPDVVDARFVAPGCLASLHADGVLTTRCRT